MNTLTTTLPVARSGPMRDTARALERIAALAAIALRRRWQRIDAPTPAARMRAQAERYRDVCAALVDIHGLRLRIAGAAPEGPSIIVANHLGYLDPLILSALVPCAPIAKREAARWPLIGPTLARLGLNFVERGDPASGAAALRRARRALDAGVSVLVFPEGTTTRGDRVLPFHRGIFGLAHRLGVPVVPVAMRFTDPACCWVGDDPFIGHYWRMARAPRIPVRIDFGAPERITGHATLAAERLRRCVDDLRRGLPGE